MKTEDGHIIHECINGDYASFGLLVEKYKAGVFALAYSRLRNFHDAEDVAQEVFIKAYKNLRNLRRWDSFTIWLRSTTINLCKNKIREWIRHQERSLVDDESTGIIDEASLENYRDEQSSAWHEEALEALNKALSSLPEMYSQVLTLHYLGGMSGEEISEFLSIPHATVRQRLSRAREQLKSEVLAMMSGTFEGQKLQAIFTFRIVEMVKKIKIHPVSTIRQLPWGISFLTGLVATLLILSPIPISINLTSTLLFSPLPIENQVLKVGEIPVDVVKASSVPILSGGTGKGKDGNIQNAFFLAPQAEGGTWVRKANAPIGVGFHSLAAVNDKIYAIGGTNMQFNLGLKPFTSVYEYDPKTDDWRRKSDIPTPRGYFRSSVVDGKIYAISGWTDGGFSNAVEAYDPITDSWEKKANIPTARAEAVTEQVNGKIYVIGGHNQHSGTCLSAVEEYDPKTDTWTKKKDMPIARSFATSYAINDKIYVFGGTSLLVADFRLPVEIYDPLTDTWTNSSNIPTPRVMSASCLIDEMIYIMGGSDKNFATTSIVEIYDPINDIWMKGQNMPVGIDGIPKYPMVNGKIYCIGGSDANLNILSDTWEFTPEGLQTAVSPQGKLPTTWGQQKEK